MFVSTAIITRATALRAGVGVVLHRLEGRHAVNGAVHRNELTRDGAARLAVDGSVKSPADLNMGWAAAGFAPRAGASPSAAANAFVRRVLSL
jgi:hypothetical protein